MAYRNAEEIGWKAVSKTGVVAAGGAGATAAGIEILEKGGNAADLPNYMSPSKILIPVDGSPASLRAVDFAIEMLARNSGNSLVLRQGSKPVDPVPFLARL